MSRGRYFRRKSPRYLLDQGLGVSQSRSECYGVDTNFGLARNHTPTVQPVARRHMNRAMPFNKSKTVSKQTQDRHRASALLQNSPCHRVPSFGSTFLYLFYFSGVQKSLISRPRGISGGSLFFCYSLFVTDCRN